MAKLTPEMQATLNASHPVVVATASADGQPNCNYVGVHKLLDDETIYLSDQFFLKTKANLLANPKVAIIFMGEAGAFTIHGTATYINEGEQFEELKAWANGVLVAMGKPACAKGGAIVHIDAVYNTSSGPNAGKQLL